MPQLGFVLELQDGRDRLVVVVHAERPHHLGLLDLADLEADATDELVVVQLVEDATLGEFHVRLHTEQL